MAESTRPATRSGPLGSRLIALVLIATLPLAALSVVNALYDRQSAADDTYGRTAEVVSTGVGVITETVDQTDTLLTIIGRTTNTVGASCSGELDTALIPGSTYRNLYAIAPDGTVACTAQRQPLEADVSGEEWYRRTGDRGDITVTAPAESLTTGDPVMIVSHPTGAPTEPDAVSAGSTAASAVLAASIELQELVAFIDASEVPSEAVVQVLGADGEVLARNVDSERYLLQESPLFPRMEGNDTGDLQGRGIDGVERLYSYERVDVGGETMYVMAGISRDAAYAGADQRLAWSLGIILVLGAGVGVLVLLAGRSMVVAPVERLRSAMAGFRSGDITRRAGDVGGPAEIAELGSSFDAMADEIQQRLEYQQGLLDQLEEASEAERQTIAAGIHDEVLQTLSAVGIRIQLLRRGADERQQAELDRAREMLDATSAQLRGLLFDLRPPEFDRIGLAATLRETLEVRLGPDLDAWSVTGEPGPDVPDQVQLLLYRIAQQALANIREHADADRVDIRFATTGPVITMEISDDGLGFDLTRTESEARPGHIGLQVMRDRARAAGGDVTITAEEGLGTSVRVDIPFRDHPAAEQVTVDGPVADYDV